MQDDVDKDADAAEVFKLDAPAIVARAAFLCGSASRCSDHLFSRIVERPRYGEDDKV